MSGTENMIEPTIMRWLTHLNSFENALLVLGVTLILFFLCRKIFIRSKEQHSLAGIHLRVVGGLNVFCALFKIVVIITTTILFAGLFKGINPMVSGGLNFTKNYESNHGAIIIIFFALIIILSIFEFIAGLKVVNGSIKARNFLIFSWIFNCFVINFMPLFCYGNIYYFLVMMIAIYALWVLTFRKNAQKEISSKAKESSIKVKVAIMATFVAVLFLSVTFRADNNTTVTRSARSSTRSSKGFKILGVRLIAINDDAVTNLLCKKLQKKLHEKLLLPVTIQNCNDGDVVEQKNYVNVANELVLAVDNVAVEDYKKYFKEEQKTNTLPPNIKNKVLKNLPTPLFFESNPKYLIRKGEKKIRFKISTLFTENDSCSTEFLMLFQNDLQYDYRTAYFGTLEYAVDKMSNDVCRDITKFVETNSQKHNIIAPDYMCEQHDLKSIIKENKGPFKFLENAKLIGVFKHPRFSELLLYKIPVNEKNIVVTLNSIARELFTNNMDYDDWNNMFYDNQRMVQLVMPATRAVILKKNERLAKDTYIPKEIASYGKYMLVVYAVNNSNLSVKKRGKLSPEYLTKFERYAKDYPQSFISIQRSNIQQISKAVYKKVIEEVINNPKSVINDIIDDYEKYFSSENNEYGALLRKKYEDTIINKLAKLLTTEKAEFANLESKYIGLLRNKNISQEFKSRIKKLLAPFMVIVNEADLKEIKYGDSKSKIQPISLKSIIIPAPDLSDQPFIVLFNSNKKRRFGNLRTFIQKIDGNIIAKNSGYSIKSPDNGEVIALYSIEYNMGGVSFGGGVIPEKRIINRMKPNSYAMYIEYNKVKDIAKSTKNNFVRILYRAP